MNGAIASATERHVEREERKATWGAERAARRTATLAHLAADPDLAAKYASRRRTQEGWVAATEAVAGKIAA
jgi:hypothetical protein